MAKKKKTLGSLRDQLKEAGLVTAKQARKAEKGALRSELRIKKGLETDDTRAAVEAERQKKADEDRRRNAERDQQAREKALLAQVKQLVASNSQHEPGDVAYNFSVENKIKKIYVSESNKVQLNKGNLAVVQGADKFDLVPTVVAEKIAARSPQSVLYLYDRSKDEVDDNDPYKDYPIPDDLEW